MQALRWFGVHGVRIATVVLIASALWQVAGYGQLRSRSGSPVQGQVLDGEPGGSLRVTLTREGDAGVPLSVDVSPSGDFRFTSVSSGDYLLEVNDRQGRTLYERPVSISGVQDNLMVRLPARGTVRPSSGTVSARELRRKIDPKALKEHEKGMQASESGRFDKAISHFQKAVGLDPSFAEAYNMLGASFHSLKQDEEAARQFRRAAELDPHSGRFATNLATATAVLGQYPESETSARAAIAADRDLKEARFLLGFSRYKQAKYDQETVENLQWGAIEYPRAHIYAAEILAQLGRRGEAAAELRGYLKSSDQGVNRSQVEAWLSQLAGPAGRHGASAHKLR